MTTILIPELASQLVEEYISKNSDDNSKTIIFAGSKSVGKTTLLYTFLDKHDPPRETLLLEYSFGRKSTQKQGLEKTICHVWEYGGKLELLKTVINSVPQQGKSTFFIMLDLSKIKNLWSRLELCLNAYEEIKKNNTESDFEMVIIGGKYDIFKNYDSEIKKTVCVTLRCAALVQKSHLYFYSSKEPPLVRKMKDILQSFGFKDGYESKEKTTNYTKPLSIPKGSDSWENVGLSAMSLDEIKMKHISRIPQESNLTEFVDDRTSGPQKAHAEPILDSLVKIKYDELRIIDDLDTSTSIDDYLNNLR